MKLAKIAALVVGWATGVVAVAHATETPARALAVPDAGGRRYEEVRRFPTPEARQGVAVDAEFFYAINNHAIAKYRKATGERVAVWNGGGQGPFIHLNAGTVVNGRLYCAHSNYPAVPMLSSIEIFDTATLEHVGTHSFGRADGSLTWLQRRAGRWLACFVHYAKRGAEPDRDPAWSQVIEFDDEWRRLRAWSFPLELTTHFAGYSASGGAFGPDGALYVTGHDYPELYVLAFPRAGSVLEWKATIPIAAEGQAFDWDPAEPGVFYSIARRTREVIVGRIVSLR